MHNIILIQYIEIRQEDLFDRKRGMLQDGSCEQK